MSIAVVKIRYLSNNRFLGIPMALRDKVKATHMMVDLDESGRLIYTPVQAGV